ncbi:MAG: LuxR C-terminal-related transcriptional regulator [Caldilineaceae bacterium]
MPIRILATKLYIPPPPPHCVHRLRLIERLNDGLHRKLALISAPAGFGKTTLVSEWLADLLNRSDDGRGAVDPAPTAPSIAWLSLAEDDSEISRFLTYLLAALQRAAPTIGQELADALHSPQAPPVGAILTALLNEIASAPENLILVLDDYHLVDAKEIDEMLAFLLEHLPPQFHLVITTREDPNLPLARLRARGQLTEIRAGDLRFTADEAAAFLNQMMGLALSAADVSALEARTEGWIAGLQLAAISMQGHATDAADRATFIRSFTGSHRFVMDYLIEEVLEQQPTHLQRFLLRTSLLNRLCGPLCDAVMEDSAATGQAILEQLEQANLFLIPLDNARRWYRYHYLFADLLRQRYQQQMAASQMAGSAPEDAPDEGTEIHRRASIWFAANDLALEALQHALAAQDFARAASLLEQVWRSMDDDRQSARWLGWVQKLPDELIRTRPVLNAGYAWAMLERGELEAADARLRVLEQWLATTKHRDDAPDNAVLVTDEAEFQALPATIAAARAYHALAMGDLLGTKEYARRTLDLLPADNHLRRGVPATLLGLAYWTDGELELAHRTFDDGIANFRMAGNIRFAITGAYVLADIEKALGRLRDAEQTYRQSLALAAEHSELIRRGAADLYTGLSELACERDDLESAATHLQKSAELGEKSPLPRWRYRWLLAQAHLKQAQGELAAALMLFDEAERAYVRGPVPDVRSIGAMKARIWVRQGKLDVAAMWAQNAGLDTDDELSYLREFEHITLTRLRLAQYRSHAEASLITEAIELLTRLLAAAEQNGRMGSVIEILLLLALAHEAQGDLSSALEPLARALALAEPEGYFRLFVDEGPPMARLLHEAAAQAIRPGYVARLLAALTGEAQKVEQHPRSQVVSTPAPANQPLIEPLSDRELEVLHLIAQGLTNRAIADRLFIALSTVKGHNRVIFGKLQVNRRTEAVARARELGLV